MTELEECARCDDEWLREVQEEVRHGKLSEHNHGFLHGEATKVPGSWIGGDVACGSVACRALASIDEALEAQKKRKRKAAQIVEEYVAEHEFLPPLFPNVTRNA